MKKIIPFILILGFIFPVQPAFSAIDGCNTTTAVPHAPKNVEVPQTASLASYPSVITLVTNCGEIDILLESNLAPTTSTSLITLFRANFYDNSLCHRLTTSGIYVIQCGDPTSTGSGGTRWQFKDENLPINGVNNYPAGTVGMANSGPNTNSSQFFFSYKDSTIAPAYSIWGHIISGMEILEYVAKNGVAGGSSDGKPAISLSINSVIEQDANYLKAYNKGINEQKRIIGVTDSTLSKKILDLENQISSLGFEKQSLISQVLMLAENNQYLLASKAAADKAAADKAAAVTITCVKGKLTKKVTGVSAKCPSGYTKK